jgi:thiamine kinase-like enzyme
MNKKEQLVYIENYAFPKILFKNDLKFILNEIDDLSICKEYRHLFFTDIAKVVIDNFFEMKKNVAKELGVHKID